MLFKPPPKHEDTYEKVLVLRKNLVSWWVLEGHFSIWMGLSMKFWYMDKFGNKKLGQGQMDQPNPKLSICINPHDNT